MAMPLEKAKKILQAYKNYNYSAIDALPSVGYSRETADKSSARTLDTAVNTIARSGDQDAILEFLGMTKSDLSKEYKKIIEQDKNYPAKLRALEPLLKKQGIQWDEQKINMNPTLNLTVKEIEPLNRAADSVAQSILCDVNCTAEHGHTIERLPEGTSRRPDSPEFEIKEEDSRAQNFSEKVAIDKTEEVLPTYIVVTETVNTEDEQDFMESLDEENG